MEQYMLAQREHFILQPAARHRQTSCALPDPNPGVRTARGKIMSTFRRATMRRSKFSREFKFEAVRSEEHTSELQSLMRISYAVFCLNKKKTQLKKEN